MSELEHRSYLVQRLKQPYRLPAGHQLATLSEVFSFGGGLKNGGLSDEAMGLLREVWSFDYMGAAEFEFGAVPEALRKIAKASALAPFEFTIPLVEVAANWRDKSKAKPKGEATIYVLCPEGWRDEVKRRIRAWAAESTDSEFSLKEGTRLASALRPIEDYDRETCGWLELDNGFIFFTNKEMWEQTCALFGVVTNEAAAA